MINRAIYIEIDKVSSILEKAVEKKLITRIAAETIIMDLYHETDPNRFKKPSHRSNTHT